MCAKFKLNNPRMDNKENNISYTYHKLNIPNLPIGTPVGIPSIHTAVKNIIPNKQTLPQIPGTSLHKSINYYADYGGCGFWRMIWPELLINANQKGVVNGLTSMVLDPRFYSGLKSIRLQRQATPVQLQFAKFLKDGSKQLGFRMIYDIDDVIFKDDIPDFNRCKIAYEDESILKSSLEIMQLCNEISVTCDYMRDYYIEKTGNKNITVIPNYAPKLWADGFYNKDEINKRYNKNKKKPRIGYCGSGTHFDVTNRTKQNDDFTHIVKHIISTRKDFQWVMMGGFPLPLKPYIDNGEIELVNWSSILDYPRAMYNLNLNATIAPLADCIFNRAKSNIKFLEAAYQGLPGVYQDMVTYKDALLKFKTGNELIDQLKYLLTDEDRYMKYSSDSRAYGDTMWLDDHINEYTELYFTEYGSSDRVSLSKNNPK